MLPDALFFYFKAFYETEDMSKGRVKSCGLLLRVLVLLVICISVLKHKF